MYHKMSDFYSKELIAACKPYENVMLVLEDCEEEGAKMYKHTLKLQQRFVKPILDKEKQFEIRKNDRCFQKGDQVQFNVVDNDGYELSFKDVATREFELKKFEITYVISGWGLKNGYVVFGIKEV